MAVDAFFGVGEDGRWVSSEDGLVVARQNGKGVVLQVIEGFCAFELHFSVVMHTAHEFATCQEHQYRLEDMIQNAPHLHARVKDSGGYKHANGQESINLKDGCRIIFKARTKMGARGYSIDLLVWDEAMVVPDTVVGSMLPALRASKVAQGPKVIYAGSAVDQEVHEYGVNLARVRERGINQTPGVAYLEWSAPFDHPSQMTGDLLADRTLFRLGNPSMDEGMISEEYMAGEVSRMPPRQAAVELDGVGDWPRTDGLDDSVIAIQDWDALTDPSSRLVPPYALAFDVSPERWTSVAVAGFNAQGEFHVEVQEHKQGTGWVADRVAEMVENSEGDIEQVVCDSVGPAASLIVKLEELSVKVEKVNSHEHGQACGRLVDMVNDGTLRHLGSAELRDAVRGAKSRPMNDTWLWSRKNSSVDISPLVAATLALGAAAGIGSTSGVFVY